MYWIDLTKEPDIDNRELITIHVPKKNVVPSDAMLDLLKHVAEEGSI